MKQTKSYYKTMRPGYSQLSLVAGLVLLSGLITILSVLVAVLRHRRIEVSNLDADFALLVGMTFVYLSSLLKRGKRTAWFVALPLYGFIFIRNFQHFLIDLPNTRHHYVATIINLALPLLAIASLIIYRGFFTVKSGLRNFRLALARSVLVLLVAFLFGTAGFQFLDERDFHQEIPLLAGMHYTIDQFGLTTAEQLTPYSRRAKVFLDSLTAVSLISVGYTAAALFSPLRFRFSSHQQERTEIAALIKKYPRDSEDFFKLWPPDKAYFFNSLRNGAIAYQTVGSSALCVSDPAGDSSTFSNLLEEFLDFCYTNDWQPAFIHAKSIYSELYEKYGFELQKIGEEAVVDIKHYLSKVVGNKYFRHINNKFTKLGYITTYLKPPHSREVLNQLSEISADWLKAPGRTERTFMMGYFSEAYMQQCNLMVVKTASGRIQAFLNQLPEVKPDEASIDFVRHRRGSPGNINDFLLINFIKQLQTDDFSQLNLGLCPLVGLDKVSEDERSVIDNFLKLAYAGGNWIYSFKGLQRFKAKYEPTWRSRYIVYQGGLAGFSRLLRPLIKAMSVKN